MTFYNAASEYSYWDFGASFQYYNRTACSAIAGAESGVRGNASNLPGQ